MYLKSIEMHGFKSFAQTTKLEFHNGITGVVGPNGSGKSNVADAVRWVLGEQSAKQLRGSSMQDVIFAGTEGRKPLSFAYVALTLDNSDHVLPIDYEEVTVARRVYRSGETEYLLNGAPCRLRDVYELFYDTGVGKEGYSIIGQGQVEKVLSGKPEDRRELFDEAAGIVKFKKRKAAAAKKLEHEQENLVRINDILGELEKQVGPLEKQAEKARIYLDKREQIKKLDVNCFLLDLARIDNELAEVDKNAKVATEDLENANKEHEKIKSDYENIQQKITSLDEKIESIRDEQAKSSVAKTDMEGQIRLLTEQIHTAEMSDEHFKSRMDSIEEAKAEYVKQQTEYDAQKHSIDDQIAEVQKRLAEANANYENIQAEIKRCTDGIEQQSTEIIKILNDRANMKSKQQHFDTMLEQIQIRKAELNSRLLSRKTQEEALLNGVKDAEKELEESQKRLKALADKAVEFMKEEKVWNDKTVENNKHLEGLNEEYLTKKTRLESLRNIAERYDGYNESIRRVMSEKKHGVCGVVSDLIKVDKKYETAIETALGGNIQNIVTEDEKTAKDMISFLKENRLGRATFLPLDSVSGRVKTPSDDVLTEKGVVSLANELVDCDEKYEDVVRYLLGRVVVAENVNIATSIARKNKFSLHIVTLEGEYLSPGGSITGGAFKNKGNLLGRNREIEDLEKELKRLEESIKKANERAEEIKTAKSLLEEDKNKNQEALNAEKLVENTAKINVDRAKELMDNSSLAYEGLNQESAEIEKQIADIDAQKKSALKELEDSEARENELKTESEKLANILDQQTYLEGTAQRTVSEIQMEEATVRQRVEFASENLERVNKEIERLDNEAKELENSRNSAADEKAKKLQEIEDIKAGISAGDENFAKLEQALKDTIAEKESSQEQYSTFFTRQGEITDKIALLDKEIFRLNSQREKLEENKSYQNSYMWTEYEITAHIAEEMKDPELNDLPEMKKEIRELKDEVKRLGDVNVNAIEDFREVNTRYTFLKAQHDDLVKSEEDLKGIILELDEGMRKQFEEAFAKIQTEFNSVFRQLFGGGKGSLELVEDEDKDILECGVKIIAQPPGKKLQNMMMLSGGEKSLTAIALLFAIQNLKPSPFCLLDEIEAALDDSNVDRFAKYLGKLTENTQFIVITHRRGTMNAADRLYGITMQEKGVSTLVSVNLIEDKLDD
ncbi:MAG: chromosome segregation protein SMC [Lachnospiraceae bacterium]|nr:chromosome segregation protein SMC [Lachnospiraceae bacterium]